MSNPHANTTEMERYQIYMDAKLPLNFDIYTTGVGELIHTTTGVGWVEWVNRDLEIGVEGIVEDQLIKFRYCFDNSAMIHASVRDSIYIAAPILTPHSYRQNLIYLDESIPITDLCNLIMQYIS